jgi:hypothetical protein
MKEKPNVVFEMPNLASEIVTIEVTFYFEPE